MKKTLLFCLMAVLFIGANAQIKVGYFGMTKTMPTADPLLTLLQNDVNFTVTTNYTAAKAENPTYDLSVYDVIVIQESTAGDAAVLFPANSLGLSKISKPVLYNKSYAFKAGRALATGSGTSTGFETKGILTITVAESAKNNDLFKACTFEGTTNDIKLLESGAADTGLDTDTKALNYTTGTVLTPANPSLATVTGITNSVICFNDIPSGTTIDGQTTAARMITVGMNFGAMTKNATNLTLNGLTLLRNAVYMLAGLTVPSTQATRIIAGLNNQISSSTISFDGKTVRNINSEVLNVYNTTGKLIKTSNTNIDMSNFVSGIYLIKSQGSTLKVSLLK
jgi:hypothetical protein